MCVVESYLEKLPEVLRRVLFNVSSKHHIFHFFRDTMFSDIYKMKLIDDFAYELEGAVSLFALVASWVPYFKNTHSGR